MNKVVEYYENYREEDRLTTNNARRIELVTTLRKLDALLEGKTSLLDCAAGTGAYAFHYAEAGMEVTATDITPRHIQVIDEILKEKPYTMKTAVADATDLSMFADASFDVVLNMGPFYHLTDEKQREACWKESLRVLKKGGILVCAYIPRLYLNQMISLADTSYVQQGFLDQIRDTGILTHDDPKCFWTDTYYSTAEEMEALYRGDGLKILDHFAQDGILPMMSDIVDEWTNEQFQTWADYYYSVCSDRSGLGMSNHVVIVGEKQ